MLARDSVENNSYFRDTVRIEVVDLNGEVLAEWNRVATDLSAKLCPEGRISLNREY